MGQALTVSVRPTRRQSESVGEADSLSLADTRHRHEFEEEIDRELCSMKLPYVVVELLTGLHLTIAELDFDTGVARTSTPPQLLTLMSLESIDEHLNSLKYSPHTYGGSYSDDKPWEIYYRSGTGWEGSMERTHEESYTTARVVSDHLKEDCNGTMQALVANHLMSDWQPVGHINDVQWDCEFVTLAPSVSPNESTTTYFDRPHFIGHLADPTPFVANVLRTSELAMIAKSVFKSPQSASFSHVDLVGVTIISHYDHDVRVVQGLVNVATKDINIRISRSIELGYEASGDSSGGYNTDFITLLAYGCGEVFPTSP